MTTAYPESSPIYVPAGSWIRARSLNPPTVRTRRPDVGPEWDGMWHVASGDIRLLNHGWRLARAACGRLVRASIDRRFDGLAVGDAVVTAERPTVDACSRCLRLTGDVAAANPAALQAQELAEAEARGRLTGLLLAQAATSGTTPKRARNAPSNVIDLMAWLNARRDG